MVGRHWVTGVNSSPVFPTSSDRRIVRVRRERADAALKVGFTIPAATAARIDEVSAQAGVTPFMVVHTRARGAAVRLSSTSDIAIGTPVGGRGQTGLDPLIGMFVNTLILRTGVEPGASFEQILVQAKSVDLDAFANADIPFDEVVGPATWSVGRVRPVHQVWLTFEQTARPNWPDRTSRSAMSPACASSRWPPARYRHASTCWSRCPGTKTRDKAADWTGSIIYATDLFDESTVESFTGNLLRIRRRTR